MFGNLREDLDDIDVVASSPLLADQRKEVARVEPSTINQSMTIKAVVRERILVDMVRSVKTTVGSAWIVCVVDPFTLKVLSSACRNYDIMEEGVTLVEKITLAREPVPHLTALYFLTPTEESVSALIADYKDKKRPQYGNCHIFFSAPVPNFLMNRIKEAPNLLAKIKTFKEVNLEILAVESQVFTLESAGSLDRCFNPEVSVTGQEVLRLTKQLVSVCATLGELPLIRYPRNSTLCQQVASKVHDQVSHMVKTGALTPQTARPQATLMIVDRSIDVVAPLLHEFTYQAMVYDLLPVDGERYKFMYTNNANKQEEKDVLLNENDSLWPSLRHMHIAETITKVIDDFNEFISNNKASQLMKKDKVHDLREMGDAMRQMPQYQEMLGKYSLHIHMGQQCMKLFQDTGLETIAAIEQDLVMGEDADGSSVNQSKAFQSVLSVLQNPHVSKVDKLRLVMIYIITQSGVKDQERRQMLDAGGFTHAQEQAISNLFYLGVTLEKSRRLSFGKKGGGKNQRKKRADDVPYSLSRYQTVLKSVIEEGITDTLSKDDYPYVVAPSGSSGAGYSGASAGQSIRGMQNRQYNWWTAKQGQKKQDDAPQLSGGRYIVFVAGGITYSEIRAAYELTKTHNREVIVGSSKTLTAKTFLEDLQRLKEPDNSFAM